MSAALSRSAARPRWPRRFAAYATGALACGLARWIRLNFGAPSVDQVLYHLQYAEGAAVQMGGLFLQTFIAEALVFPLLFAALATMLHGQLASLGPRWRRALRASAVLAAGTGLAVLLQQFSVFAHVAAQFEPDHFAARHVDAAQVPLVAPAGRRNLILVYVESLEQAYGDPALFGRDLLAPLRELGGQPLLLRDAPGTSWTIAGMVATRCGVPLRVYSDRDLRPAGGGRVFLPGATCLGDLLQAHGWHNVFLGGAPLSFAGKGRFLRDHGYVEAWGREEWERAGVPPRDFNEWGLYDGALLQQARERLAALHATGRPFNLTLLTLDMHNPHGFLSPECRAEGARTFAGIVECTGRGLADFVRFARERGYLEDTVVVIVGDHLAVPNPVWETLQRDPARRVWGLVLAPPGVSLQAQPQVAFDLYPALAQWLGFEVPGGRLGLGQAGSPAGDGVEGEAPLSLAALRGSGAYRALWRGRKD